METAELDQQIQVIECSLPEFVAGFAVHGFLLDAATITDPERIVTDQWHNWRMRGNA